MTKRQQQPQIQQQQSETVSVRPMVREEPTVLAVRAQAEIDSQIATAKRYPRDVGSFKERCLALATIDKETAESCTYTLPRDGKNIEGKSVRLAEIVLATWGNVAVAAEVIDEDQDWVYAMGRCRDLESNVSVQVMTRRRIRKSNGQKYSLDMIGTTANAACSLALRNATFHAVPQALIKPVYDACRAAAVGDHKNLGARRQQVMKRLDDMGVSEERVLAAIKVKNILEIGPEKLGDLIGMGTAIKDGEITAEEAFPQVKPPAPTPAEVAAAQAQQVPNPHTNQAKRGKPHVSPKPQADPADANLPAQAEESEDTPAEPDDGGFELGDDDNDSLV